YYYIDYELHPSIPEDMGRFHALWHRECPTEGAKPEDLPQLMEEAKPLMESNPLFSMGPDAMKANLAFQFGGNNIGGEGNYVILDAEGKGHYVGCNMNYHNLRRGKQFKWPKIIPWPMKMGNAEKAKPKQLAAFFKLFNWYGEGDDMIFIDGEEWPPSLHGTGSEDYFNTAYCPAEKYDAPYHGMTLPGTGNWGGKSSYYRFHIEDPIHFQKSIKVTIEHGHNNNRSDDISSTAYWYQAEPHKPFGLLPVKQRLPLEVE
ncbi:MAG: glycoside hydrolase family 172 protein, partial [Anaerolineae bacterium]|nr:glycoside hydrolase family 172 protein [Anaerolineae bacterium]